jgi:hypothetical protein
VDSAVAPAGVVACQAQDGGADAADGGWPAGLSGTKCFGVPAAQQVAVPAQDGVGEMIRWSRRSVGRGMV